MKTQKNDGHLKPRGETLRKKTNPAHTLMLDFQPPEPWENKICCLSRPVCGALLCKLQQRNTEFTEENKVREQIQILVHSWNWTSRLSLSTTPPLIPRSLLRVCSIYRKHPHWFVFPLRTNSGRSLKPNWHRRISRILPGNVAGYITSKPRYLKMCWNIWNFYYNFWKAWYSSKIFI